MAISETSHVTDTQPGDMSDRALLSFSSGKVFFLFFKRIFLLIFTQRKDYTRISSFKRIAKLRYEEKGNSEFR